MADKIDRVISLLVPMIPSATYSERHNIWYPGLPAENQERAMQIYVDKLAVMAKAAFDTVECIEKLDAEARAKGRAKK